MIIYNYSETIHGWDKDDAYDCGYCEQNGLTTIHYRKLISNRIRECSNEFEEAMKAFYYNFPSEGSYLISWTIERTDLKQKHEKEQE